MRRQITLTLLLGVLGTASSASAQTSTFSANSQGWLVGDFFTTTGGTAPTWVASGGNPGGFIRTEDLYPWTAFWAPSVYLGNRSSLYGGTLSYDTRLLTTDPGAIPAVVISDGTLMLQYQTLPPTTSWSTFLFPLTEAGWEVADGSGNTGPAATQSQFQQVLANLAWVHVNADWQTGPDRVDLDNFSMSAAVTPTPEPAAALLVATGLIGIGAFTRRRRASR